MIYFISALLLALMCGLFFTWTISVTPGLAKLDTSGYLLAMQSLNKAILNPAFYIIFIGSIIILPVCTFLLFNVGTDRKFYYLLTATIIYLLGSVLVTFLGNVPINNELEALNLNSMNQEELETFRAGFESKWNRMNLIRTLSSVSALCLLIFPLIFSSDS